MFKIITQREELKRENEDLKKELNFYRDSNTKLQKDIQDLYEKIDELSARNSVIEKWEKDIPTERQARERYMADVTIFYENVMKDQLARMIEEQKDYCSKIDVSEKMAQIFRSNVNLLYLFQDFFLRCQTEYMGTLQEKRDELGDED